MASKKMTYAEKQALKKVAKVVPAIVILAVFMIVFSYTRNYPVALLLDVFLSALMPIPAKYGIVKKIILWIIRGFELATAAIAVFGLFHPGLLYIGTLAYFGVCILAAVVSMIMSDEDTVIGYSVGFLSIALYVGVTLLTVFGALQTAVILNSWIMSIVIAFLALVVPIGMIAVRADDKQNEVKQETTTYYTPSTSYDDGQEMQMPPM